MPFVGFSAGMLICGENILTSNDDNDCGSTRFSGFGFTKYNFVAHYPARDGEDRAERDNRICEYHNRHANPVLALQDDGYIEIDGEGTKVVRGNCWLIEAGGEKKLLEQGRIG
jgi:peptidase E